MLLLRWHLLHISLCLFISCFFFFFFNDTATTEIYTLSYTTLFRSVRSNLGAGPGWRSPSTSTNTPRSVLYGCVVRSEEHTSELQSQFHLVCRLLLEKKKKNKTDKLSTHTRMKSASQARVMTSKRIT